MVACSLPAPRSTATRTSATGEVDEAAVLARCAAGADLDAVDRHRHLVRLEVGVGGADGGQDAAPVRVLAVDGALERGCCGRRCARPRRRRPRTRADARRSAMSLVGALGVARPAAGPGRAQTSRTAAARTPGVGRDAGGAAERAAATVSLVDMQPSESTRSKVAPGRRAQGLVELLGRSATASVVMTTSIVARPGASMPAPLAIPPTMKPSTDVDGLLGDGVGGHDRGRRRRGRRRRTGAACARVEPPAAGGPSAAARRSARSSRPRPRRRRSRAARRRARRCAWVSWKPAGPVHALAPPELSTTAAHARQTAGPAGTRATGAAWKRFAVKTPAAALSGPSLTTSATSGGTVALQTPRHAGGPEALRGAVTPVLTAPTPHGGQPGGLGEPEHEVRVLHRLPGCALAEVVDGAGDHDDPAGVDVDGGLQVHGVGAERAAVRGQLPSGRTCTNGSSPYVFASASRTSLGGRQRVVGRAVTGGEDAARHGREDRRERRTRVRRAAAPA